MKMKLILAALKMRQLMKNKKHPRTRFALGMAAVVGTSLLGITLSPEQVGAIVDTGTQLIQG
ncbi:MAG: hypothetical protein CMI08_07455 [Oceanospirillaceae bacterium]|nr:hypothetical protein [Oceanospirillaceae bacterium]MAX99027.1 hypothetical protein [Oceanospirillaceae bacterium]